MACLYLATFWHESQKRDAPKTPQDAPKMPTRRVKRTPRHPKTHPRRPQDAPRTPPRQSKMRPRHTQDTPREPQDAPRNPKTPPRRPKTPPRRLETSILVPRDLDFDGFVAPPDPSLEPLELHSGEVYDPRALQSYLILARRNARSDPPPSWGWRAESLDPGLLVLTSSLLGQSS